MHGISSNSETVGVRLGPILTILVEIEGVTIKALLDTRSLVTIIQPLLQILAKQRDPKQAPEESKAAEGSCRGSFRAHFSCGTELYWGWCNKFKLQ